MFWGKGPDKTPPEPTATRTAGSASAASGLDPSDLPASKNLPRKLQNIVDKDDKDDNFYDELISG